MSNKVRQGFTLVEILVAATIIGLLSTVGMTGFQAITRSGRDALRKSDLEQMRSALEIYKSENGFYPTVVPTCSFVIPTQYLNKSTVDPKNPTYQYCYVWETNLSYKICAHLENGDSTRNCGDTNGTLCGSNCNYEVKNP